MPFPLRPALLLASASLGLVIAISHDHRQRVEPVTANAGGIQRHIPLKEPVQPLPHSASPKRTGLAAVLAASKEFQSTRDLHGLYARLKDSENPDERQFALKAVDFCARYVIRSGARESFATAQESIPQASAEQDLVNRTLYAKCAGFRNVGSSAMWAELGRLKDIVANEEGNAAAAVKAARLLAMNNADQASELALKVLRSRQPDAIAELEPYFQELRDNRSNAAGLPTDGNVDGLAIRLAACELGKDCSSAALEMQSLCLHGGSCEDSLVEKTAKVLPPLAMQEVLRRRDEFVSAVKTGDFRAFGLK